jgi:hypothetical protein
MPFVLPGRESVVAVVSSGDAEDLDGAFAAVSTVGRAGVAGPQHQGQQQARPQPDDGAAPF